MLRIICFIILTIGLFILFDVHFNFRPKQYLRAVKICKSKTKELDSENISLKDYITSIEGKKKENLFKKANREALSDLEKIGQKDRFKKTQMVAVFCGLIGFGIGIVFNNILLAIIMAVGCYFIPLWCTRFGVYSFTKATNEELEIALSMVTTSYLRTNDLLSAVEENIDGMQGAVKICFENFLKQVKYVSPNIIIALQGMAKEIECPLFHSWINTAILCQEDYTLKNALPPIVRKFSDLKKQQMENETKMTMPLKYAIMAVSLLVFMLPLMYFLNGDWFFTLVHSFKGQVTLTVSAITAFMMLNKSIKLSSPIEFAL